MLFFVAQTLPPSMENRYFICGRARVLSRRVWDLLMAVPTNPVIYRSLSELSSQTEDEWRSLLDPTQPARLIYALQVRDRCQLNLQRIR